MSYRVGEHVTVNTGEGDWHGQIVARLLDGEWRVRVGGTSGVSMITRDVSEFDLRPIFPGKQVNSRIVVALFKANTQACQNLDLIDRVRKMRFAFQEMKTYIDKKVPMHEGEDARVRGIFLAPEYMFANKIEKSDHQNGDQRQIEAQEIKMLREFFAESSEKIPNVLIVPGSVAWRKPLKVQDSPEIIEQKAFSKRLSVDKYTNEYRRTKYKELISSGRNVYYSDYERWYPADSNGVNDSWRTLVSPLNYANGRTVNTHAEKWHLLTDATYIAKNTAHCYYNGQCIAKYNKIGDFHEVLDGGETVHIPNPRPGRFECGGITFGISICFDQSLNVETFAGAKSVPLQKTMLPVDFHILLSAHVEPEAQSANLFDGGYLLSCASANACNKVIMHNGVEIVRDHFVECDGIELDLYYF